ncbi:MAG: hypothetical protein OJF51_002968 [Nitrospira sp.]|jgi:hypothetical protein|nr:MAG: hypothetical protein OJF51_002968 [Nitrospira sp.]
MDPRSLSWPNQERLKLISLHGYEKTVCNRASALWRTLEEDFQSELEGDGPRLSMGGMAIQWMRSPSKNRHLVCTSRRIGTISGAIGWTLDRPLNRRIARNTIHLFVLQRQRERPALADFFSIPLRKAP